MGAATWKPGSVISFKRQLTCGTPFTRRSTRALCGAHRPSTTALFLASRVHASLCSDDSVSLRISRRAESRPVKLGSSRRQQRCVHAPWAGGLAAGVEMRALRLTSVR